MAANPPTIIKKYGNRRLYDTGESRYITLDELSNKVREGNDVRVVDAKSGDDLTRATLTQIVIEGRGVSEFLPVPLLLQLIRLGDDALAEFFGRWVTSALEMYLQAKRGARAIAPYNPMASLPFAASDALARMWMASPFSGSGLGAGGRAPTPPPLEPDEEYEFEAQRERNDDVAELRRELEELKQSMRDQQQPAPAPRGRKRAPRRKKSKG